MVAGKTVINEEVFAELAKTALAKVESVYTAGGQKRSLVSIARIVADKVAPQISIKKIDGDEEVTASVNFELKVNVIYGQNIPNAIKAVREAVRTEVENITGYNVEKIDVIVEKLVKPEAIETAAETPDIIEINDSEE